MAAQNAPSVTLRATAPPFHRGAGFSSSPAERGRWQAEGLTEGASEAKQP